MKVALVTGGSNGIGKAIVQSLIEKGYYVYNVDPDKSKINDTNLETINIDINKLDILYKKLEKIKKIDLLINNAAIQIEKPFLDQTDEEIDLVLNTNLLSLIKLTKKIVKGMNNNSHIINISSIHGSKPRVNKITYDISKAALELFTKELSLELAPNIRVNAISIGATNTPMNDLFIDEKKKMTSLSKVPLNHILEPLDVAKVVIQIISDDFKYLNGSIIVYDGGRSLI